VGAKIKTGRAAARRWRLRTTILAGLPFISCGALISSGAFISCGVAAETKQEEDSVPRPTMRVVFNEVKTLLPLSLDEARWSDPSSRATVLASLERLDKAASILERHGRAREAGFDELALSLGRDLREAYNHYAQGDYSEARFFLAGSLQNCVSCHTRLPSARNFPMANELTDQIEIQALDPRERAWLLVTVRRFDDALSVWESLLADPENPAGQLDATGVLVDYLNVALRVRTDPDRAKRTLAQFSKREDLPVYLARRVRTWLEALDSVDVAELTNSKTPSVDSGARLAKEGGQLAQGPYGRDGLIQDLAAASQLVRYLEADRAKMQEVTRNRTASERNSTSRAYYWLGIVEARSLDGFWVNQSEAHFEAAIRSDPRGPFAELAYAQLEETQVLGFGGASGEDLPADIWTNLKELRELMGVE
jgi:hypothetical protein